jgi:hypothetical protein
MSSGPEVYEDQYWSFLSVRVALVLALVGRPLDAVKAGLWSICHRTSPVTIARNLRQWHSDHRIERKDIHEWVDIRMKRLPPPIPKRVATPKFRPPKQSVDKRTRLRLSVVDDHGYSVTTTPQVPAALDSDCYE